MSIDSIQNSSIDNRNRSSVLFFLFIQSSVCELKLIPIVHVIRRGKMFVNGVFFYDEPNRTLVVEE